MGRKKGKKGGCEAGNCGEKEVYVEKIIRLGLARVEVDGGEGIIRHVEGQTLRVGRGNGVGV